MKTIFSLSEFSDPSEFPFESSTWTAVIPMAGRGTRLNFDKPKALFPILGRSILDWMVRNLTGNCEKIVLVVSPEGEKAILEEVKKIKTKTPISTVIQENPKGMADAILLAKPEVHTENVLVVWGDQVTLSKKTLSVCQSILEKNHALLSLPTHLMQAPYICFDRDENGKLTRVRQRREGEIQEDVGENDCGVFCFNTQKLFQTLEKNKSTGNHTKEFNLLPLLPLFDENQHRAVTVRLDSPDETLGINTVEDAKKAEKILSKR